MATRARAGRPRPAGRNNACPQGNPCCLSTSRQYLLNIAGTFEGLAVPYSLSASREYLFNTQNLQVRGCPI